MTDDYRDVDVLIAGGGPSGIAAGIAAARQGAETLVVERYGRLGGGATTNLIQPFMGTVNSPFVAEMMHRLKHDPLSETAETDTEVLDLIYADMLREAGAEILLHAWVFDVIKRGDRLVGAQMLSKQGILRIGAKVVVDATGDGDVAFTAGVPFERGRASDGLLQPMSIMFRIGGVDKARAFLCGGERQALKVRVPEGVWHEVVQRGSEEGELPPTVGVIRLYEGPRDERTVNATQVNYVDGTDVADLTRAEYEGRRQAVRVLQFLRRHAPGYEDAYIARMPAAIGVRETRRFLGMAYLRKEDLCSGRKWDTAVVKDANFVVDIHNPNGAGQADGLAERVQPYDIPYGCLVPRDIDGLLLAGRCISGSHEAHASYRVQRIVMAIGAAAGVAAAVAVQSGQQPRDVDAARIQRILGLFPRR
jgi:hypothetical protein